MITIKNLNFRKFLSEKEILKRTREIAASLKTKYGDESPVFLSVLNGSFIFAADLVRAYDGECEITFVKLKSYDGTASTGDVRTAIGLSFPIQGKPVILLEDIIDSGKTLYTFLPVLEKMQPKSIEVVTLLHKPDALAFPLKIDHVGFTIPTLFVVGYGLDYDGFGRNLPDIYQLADADESTDT